MRAIYDQLAQALVSAPLAVQLVVLFAIALPLCSVAGVVLLRVVDLVPTPRRRQPEMNAPGSTGTGWK